MICIEGGVEEIPGEQTVISQHCFFPGRSHIEIGRKKMMQMCNVAFMFLKSVKFGDVKLFRIRISLTELIRFTIRK